MVLLHDMGQSLAHLLVHAIFSTKDRRPFLHSEEIRNEIYQEEIREIFKRHRVAFDERYVWDGAPEGRTPFQGGSLYITSPRAEAPDFAKPTSRLAFWRHIPQTEGRHSFSDGAWAILLDRSAVGRKRPNS